MTNQNQCDKLSAMELNNTINLLVIKGHKYFDNYITYNLILLRLLISTYIVWVLEKRAFSVMPVTADAHAIPKMDRPQNTWWDMYIVRPPYPSFGKRNAIKPQTH